MVVGGRRSILRADRIVMPAQFSGGALFSIWKIKNVNLSKQQGCVKHSFGCCTGNAVTGFEKLDITISNRMYGFLLASKRFRK